EYACRPPPGRSPATAGWPLRSAPADAIAPTDGPPAPAEPLEADSCAPRFPNDIKAVEEQWRVRRELTGAGADTGLRKPASRNLPSQSLVREAVPAPAEGRGACGMADAVTRRTACPIPGSPGGSRCRARQQGDN